jgi:uncharacterized protein YciI
MSRKEKEEEKCPVFSVEWREEGLFKDKEMPMAQSSTTYYAVLRERGENWDVRHPMRQQKQWEEHAAFMDALAGDGFIILGGPLGTGEKILLIIAADSEQAIETRLANDPWTPLGLLRLAKVERWEILLNAPQ